MNAPQAPSPAHYFENSTSRSCSIHEHHEWSPVGSGTVTAKLRVVADTDLDESNVDLTLRWEPDDTEMQPDFWEVIYSHRVQVIWRKLREYLVRYSPCTEEMWDTIQKLDLPDNIQAAIKEAE